MVSSTKKVKRKRKSSSKKAEDPIKPAEARSKQTNPSSTNDALPSTQELHNLEDLVAPHIQSFDYMLDEGIHAAIHDILPQEMIISNDANKIKLKFWFESAEISYPMRSISSDNLEGRIFPSECREAGKNYAAPLTVTICKSVNNKIERIVKSLGNVPIMVKSKKCHLSSLTPKQLIRRHEDATELGGYFICNGNERVIRMLQIPKRNHIMALDRPSFKKRGAEYTSKAVTIRCCGLDQTSKTITLHYLQDGTARIRLTIKKSEYFIPVMLLLKALLPYNKDQPLNMVTDKEIYLSLLRGLDQTGDTFMADRIELCLRQTNDLKLYTTEQCLSYIGSQFRAVLPNIADDMSDIVAGLRLIQRHIFVHIPPGNSDDKFNLLIQMMMKLYSFVKGSTGADNADALQNQELLLPGHLYNMILKERLDMLLNNVRLYIEKDLESNQSNRLTVLNDSNYFRKVLDRQGDIGNKLFYFLSTGNLVSESGLDLMQVSGYTIVAEKLNRYRFLSHFRSVHRGQFFTEMKTTAVRKLLPESWGFMCPVHTPDGSPCGLLNHLAVLCCPITHPLPATCPAIGTGNSVQPSALHAPVLTLPGLLAEFGMTPCGRAGDGVVLPYWYLPVMLDGKVVGYASEQVVKEIAIKLRFAKAKAMGNYGVFDGQQSKVPFSTARAVAKTTAAAAPGNDTDMLCGHTVPATLEVSYIPASSKGGAYPGLFLATTPARFMRPVRQINTGRVELVGAMSQTFMEIAVREEEIRAGIDTHVELDPTSMLSLIASLTPFSDFNQSPRNMYQCQMGKQTMGTPVHNFKYRTDTKMYRIQTPQAPIVQCDAQANFAMDEYPNGTNAVVAVISYTGYDMEDAMILNKSSFERGFAHATVYKTKTIDLNEKKPSNGGQYFGNEYPKASGKSGQVSELLGADGLPHVGQRILEGQPLACCIDEVTGKTRLEKHKEAEPCVVSDVRLVGEDGKTGPRKANITVMYNRNPVVGDKFSSRHGQKGVMSVTWPMVDMPFSESGMTPDIIINPHAFPSRMTIGMLIESMAGKAGALHGVFQDSTPFRMQGDEEDNTAVDYFGDQLRAAGYHYYGSEPLYSGIQGTVLQADIYIGVVYYQRLRHMVSDKSQVRSTGPIDSLTHQPIKGRKRHGGVRFGEMERDSLLAHGVGFLIQDRLLNCSDKHIAYICCGSLLCTHNVTIDKNRSNISQSIESSVNADAVNKKHASTTIKCALCGRTDSWRAIAIPYVYRYLTNELAAMGIRISIDV